MELMKKLDNSKGLLISAKDISMTLCSMGKPEEALSICRETLDIAGGSKWPQSEVQIYLRCAVAELELNKPELAFKTLKKVEGLLNHFMGHFGSKSHMAQLQAEVYKAQGKYDQAYRSLLDHVELAEELAKRSKDEKLSRLRLAAEIKAAVREKKILAENKRKLENSNSELREVLARTKILRGLLPICSNCKRIRSDEGYWTQIENYVSQHSELLFSHGLCPECKTMVEKG